MITERLADRGGVPLDLAQERFRPFQTISAKVKAIVDKAKIEIDPTLESDIPLDQIAEYCRVPMTQYMRGIAAIAKNLNSSITREGHIGSKDKAKTLINRRTALVVGLLVAKAENEALGDLVTVVVHGDTTDLNTGSANLVDVELPHPTNDEDMVYIGTSFGSLSTAIRGATNLNIVTSGKLVAHLLEECTFETEPETADERILRLGIESKALALGFSDLDTIAKSRPSYPQIAQGLRFEIEAIKNRQKAHILEIHNAYINNAFADVLKITKIENDNFVMFELYHVQKREKVFFRFPKPIYEKLVRNLPAN